MLPHARLFNPKGPDRVAAIRAEPAWPSQDRFTLLVSVGVSRAKLKSATLLGPFDAASLAVQMAEQFDALTRQGFLPAGLEAMMTALKSERPEHRAHAALRLGWRREKLAAVALLEAFSTAEFDRGSIVDALGLIGDARAVPAARQEAERKLLSRRRSGVEALRNLGDAEGLAAAKERSRERLPDSLRNLAAAERSDGTALAMALLALPEKERGLAFDTLYELGTASSTRAAKWYAARNLPPRKAALVSPEPSKKPGPIRVTAIPSASAASNTVGSGCQTKGSGPSSQLSSLRSRS